MPMLNLITKFSAVYFLTIVLVSCALDVKDDKNTARANNEIKALKFYEEANDEAKDGEIDAAIELFKNVIKLKPDFATAYTGLGLQYLHKKELDKAQKEFKKAISLDRNEFVAYNHYAVILRMQGEFLKAKEYYLKAIKINSKYAQAHLNIGILYDIYLYDHKQAMHHYKTYQSLTTNEDKLVAKWIVDIDRQIAISDGDGG